MWIFNNLMFWKWIDRTIEHNQSIWNPHSRMHFHLLPYSVYQMQSVSCNLLTAAQPHFRIFDYMPLHRSGRIDYRIFIASFVQWRKGKLPIIGNSNKIRCVKENRIKCPYTKAKPIHKSKPASHLHGLKTLQFCSIDCEMIIACALRSQDCNHREKKHTIYVNMALRLVVWAAASFLFSFSLSLFSLEILHSSFDPKLFKT